VGDIESESEDSDYCGCDRGGEAKDAGDLEEGEEE